MSLGAPHSKVPTPSHSDLVMGAVCARPQATDEQPRERETATVAEATAVGESVSAPALKVIDCREQELPATAAITSTAIVASAEAVSPPSEVKQEEIQPVETPRSHPVIMDDETEVEVEEAQASSSKDEARPTTRFESTT